MNKINISVSTLLTRNEADFLFTEVDEETVLMNIHTSDYIGMDKMATIIWKLLETPQKMAEVILKLTEMFEVEAAQCEQEMLPALKNMVRFKLLKLA